MPIGLEDLYEVFILKLLDKLKVISFDFKANLVGTVTKLFSRKLRSLKISVSAALPVLLKGVGWGR